MSTIIETDRLAMRRFTNSDITNYLEIFSHPKVIAQLPHLKTRSDAWRQIAMVEGHWHLVGYSMMAVIEKSSGKLIGRVGPWQPDERDEPEVGWAIHPDQWGKGYATEAAVASLRYLFENNHRLQRVVHLIKDTNPESQGVARKIGATLTEEMVDHPISGPIHVWATARATIMV